MRLALLVAAVTAAALAPPAHASAPPDGVLCQWSATNVDDDTWTGYLVGGPLVASGAPVSIRCSVHAGNAAHDGPAVVAVSSEPSTVAFVAQEVVYEAPRDVQQNLCTEATVDGTRWLWTGAAWSTDPGAECPVAAPDEMPPQSVDNLVDRVHDCLIVVQQGGRGCPYVELPWELLPDYCSPLSTRCADPVLCKVLARLPDVPGVVTFDNDGDVHLAGGLVRECPPYGQ